ncbi:hypothetical protein C8R46DRAFT_923898, partial [Mycena filopes]
MAEFPSPFLTYSTPAPSSLYSASYFQQLTFKDAAQLVLPLIYLPASICGWTFTNETPTPEQSQVQPCEGVPDFVDLAPILQGMEQAFHDGARSVAVSLMVGGKKTDHLYHFSKVRLFSYLNNNKVAVQSARALVVHLSSVPLLSPPTLDHFLNLAIRKPIVGFCVTDFPLWKLSCLLGEQWLHEDVLNALAELLYFSQAAVSPADAPTTLILPTT